MRQPAINFTHIDLNDIGLCLYIGLDIAYGHEECAGTNELQVAYTCDLCVE